MTLMTIGEFGERTRLSLKAIRIYEQLGLVRPLQVDPRSGYRYYPEDQVETAQLIGLLRRPGIPLALIGETLEMTRADAARAVTSSWTDVEETMGERRALVSYLRAPLMEENHRMYEVKVRTMAERKLLTINRHVLAMRPTPSSTNLSGDFGPPRPASKVSPACCFSLLRRGERRQGWTGRAVRCRLAQRPTPPRDADV
jgi:DNA-binding transcriptional MerR regulator